MAVSDVKNAIINLSKHNVKTEVYSVYKGTSHRGARGLLGLQQRIRDVPAYITKAATKGALKTGLEAFEHSMQIVPVDTGKLADSGKLTVNNEVVARGNAGADGNTKVTVLRKPEGIEPNAKDFATLKSGSANVRISFHRTNDKGENIALWAHETLLPHGSGPYHARKPGTSGKYIEIPLNQIAKDLMPNIQKEIAEALSKIK